MPRFSVLIADYERHVPRAGLRRGLRSVSWQTADFDVHICHDGPKEIPYANEIDLAAMGLSDKTTVHYLPQRAGDTGAATRDHMMRLAQGEWFVHFNADNLLYPNCLKRLDEFIRTIPERIVIFTIWHRKLRQDWFTGDPPKVGNIDLLQLVAHRNIWNGVGFNGTDPLKGDGQIYSMLCERHPYAVLNERLAENF